MDERLYQTVKEINEAEYTANLLLLQEYNELLQADLTSKQAVVLEHIHKHKRLTVKELADLMLITSSAVSQLIGKLDKEGYLKREINPNNRREILVELDQAGWDYFERQHKVERSIAERFYSKLDPEELSALRKITFKLQKIIEAELK
ncbi:MarR family winged helix-turn-helix transcriptional regulator [Paenibacillus chitinolyticus]|uniref:MarR family winged helix-turn-helix transcriptional regulator n=1 Tax=Paenibacillus TaxID=44249 RepID=UPI001C30093C|nr:MarR family transcriptional regulator [Paenibacillus sp. GbtcB18]